MADEPTEETKTTAAERREADAARKAEQVQERQRLIRKASADVHNTTSGMLQQGLTWTEIANVLSAAAESAKHQAGMLEG